MGKPPTTKKKRASGGKRAGDKRRAHRASAAVRASELADPRAEWKNQLEALGDPGLKPEDAHEWLGRLAVATVRATANDTAVPLEQMRRDVMKQIEQAQKAIGSAKLAAELRELYAALKEGQDASSKPSGDDPLREEAPTLS